MHFMDFYILPLGYFMILSVSGLTATNGKDLESCGHGLTWLFPGGTEKSHEDDQCPDCYFNGAHRGYRLPLDQHA